MLFDWDKNKAKINLQKHGISFDEAQTVFDDDFTLTVTDDEHSFDEKRFITIGQSLAGRLLIVSHTYDGDKIRLISARKPTKGERENYENR